VGVEVGPGCMAMVRRTEAVPPKWLGRNVCPVGVSGLPCAAPPPRGRLWADIEPAACSGLQASVSTAGSNGRALCGEKNRSVEIRSHSNCSHALGFSFLFIILVISCFARVIQ